MSGLKVIAVTAQSLRKGQKNGSEVQHQGFWLYEAISLYKK